MCNNNIIVLLSPPGPLSEIYSRMVLYLILYSITAGFSGEECDVKGEYSERFSTSG